MSADDSTGPVEGTRARLERLLDEEIETYTALLRDAARATKRVRQSLACSKCGHVERKEFTVRDFPTGLKALELVLDRVEGRASQQSAGGGGGGENWVFVNKIVHPPLGCADCSCSSCRRFGVQEPGDAPLAPGVWVLHDRRDKSDVVFRTRADMLVYVQEMDELPVSG